MPMLRIVGIGIAVAGIVFLVMGIMATDTFGEGFMKSFTGHYSDKTTWFIVGGCIGIVVGGAMAAMNKKMLA